MTDLIDKAKQLGISHFTAHDFVNEIEALRHRVAEQEELMREMVEALEYHGTAYLHHEYKYAEVLAKYKEMAK